MVPRGRDLDRYDALTLYCLRCAVQPGFFHEAMAWQVNRVTPSGSLIEVKDGEVHEYTCPVCEERARWGWELKGK